MRTQHIKHVMNYKITLKLSCVIFLVHVSIFYLSVAQGTLKKVTKCTVFGLLDFDKIT